MPCSAGTAAMLGEFSLCWWPVSPHSSLGGDKAASAAWGPVMLGWDRIGAGNMADESRLYHLWGVSVQASNLYHLRGVSVQASHLYHFRGVLVQTSHLYYLRGMSVQASHLYHLRGVSVWTSRLYQLGEGGSAEASQHLQGLLWVQEGQHQGLTPATPAAPLVGSALKGTSA